MLHLYSDSLKRVDEALRLTQICMGVNLRTPNPFPNLPKRLLIDHFPIGIDDVHSGILGTAL